MSTEFIHKLLSATGGPSTAGISYYSRLMECARRANLNEAQKAQMALDGLVPEPPKPNPNKVVGTERGSAFHLLQEALAHGILGQVSVVDARAAVFSPSQKAALEAFRLWRDRWDTPEAKYGSKMLHVEYDLGHLPEEQAEIVRRIGGPLTGRADQVHEFSMDACATTFANTGILLPEPGVYALDWKSADRTKGEGHTFSYGLQAQCYMWLYNLRFPENPMKGIIFDVTLCQKIQAYEHFLVSANPAGEEMLRRYVTEAIRRRDLDVPDVGACVDYLTGKTCWWLDRGCSRR